MGPGVIELRSDKQINTQTEITTFYIWICIFEARTTGLGYPHKLRLHGDYYGTVFIYCRYGLYLLQVRSFSTAGTVFIYCRYFLYLLKVRSLSTADTVFIYCRYGLYLLKVRSLSTAGTVFIYCRYGLYLLQIQSLSTAGTVYIY